MSFPQVNIYLLKDIVDSYIENNKKSFWIVPTIDNNPTWQNNHELLVRNYEQMKESRKRIIQQRDKLQKELIHYKQIEAELEFKRVHKYESEIQSLLQSLTNSNGEISKLKIENTKQLQEILDLTENNRRLQDLVEYLQQRF